MVIFMYEIARNSEKDELSNRSLNNQFKSKMRPKKNMNKKEDKKRQSPNIHNSNNDDN